MSDEKESISDIIGSLQKTFKDIEAEYDKIADECDPDVKLAVTRWVMKHIVDHAREGGSFRYFIYDRLGFGPEAYSLLCSDGMTISNEFDLNTVPDARAALAANDHEKLKKVLSCCDEPGCYEEISCGWPSPDGYRQTCGDHFNTHFQKQQERKNEE